MVLPAPILLPTAGGSPVVPVEQEAGNSSSGSWWKGSEGGRGGGGREGEATTTPIRLVAWSLSRRQAEQKPVKGGSDGCLGHLLPIPDAASPSPIQIGWDGMRWDGGFRFESSAWIGILDW